MAYNIAPIDINVSVSMPLPAANANNTSPVLDMQAIAPNSNAWQLGRIKVVIPALPENNTGAGITFSLQAAPPSLTAGASAIAPLQPPPGTFVTPVTAQTITIPAVGAGGSLATTAYFYLATDLNGSTYQFYQFLQTVPAGVVTQAEQIQYGWTCEMGE